MLNFPKPQATAQQPAQTAQTAQPAPQAQPQGGIPSVGGYEYVPQLGAPFLPLEGAVYTVLLKSFVYKQGQMSNGFILTFRVDESTHAAAPAGRDAALMFQTGGDALMQRYRASDLRNLTGAIFRQDPATIDVDAAIKTLIAAGESLEQNGIKMQIIARGRVSKKTGKAGANFSFALVA